MKIICVTWVRVNAFGGRVQLDAINLVESNVMVKFADGSSCMQGLSFTY